MARAVNRATSVRETVTALSSSAGLLVRSSRQLDAVTADAAVHGSVRIPQFRVLRAYVPGTRTREWTCDGVSAGG